MQSTFKPAYILSIIIALLAAIASAGGLFVDGLYRDNALVTTAFQGNDVVTLFIAVPLLLAAMFMTMRGSQRAQLVWLGLLMYMLYNYVFYLYGTSFNVLFLIYVALLTLSIYALIFGLATLDVQELAQRFRSRTPARWISGFMMFFAALLGGLWIAQSLRFVATGQVPQDVVQTDHPTAVVYATDLTLLMPALVLGAVLLWRRRAWGYVVSSIMMIKATTYSLALIAMSAMAGELGSDPYLALWVVLGAGTGIATVFLLGNMQPAARRPDSQMQATPSRTQSVP